MDVEERLLQQVAAAIGVADVAPEIGEEADRDGVVELLERSVVAARVPFHRRIALAVVPSLSRGHRHRAKRRAPL
jgi:hypothetical protein